MLSIGTPNEKLYKRPLSSNSNNSIQLVKKQTSLITSTKNNLNLIQKSTSLNDDDQITNDVNFVNLFHQPSSIKPFLSSPTTTAYNLRQTWNNQCQFLAVPAPLVIAGPSGSGKSTLLKRLMNEFQDCFGFSISHTTRKPRNGEQNGREYYFIDSETFEKSIQNDEFIEYTRFSNNYYGTSKKAVKDVQNSGKICILDVEIDGVRNLKNTDLNPRFVFIKPPSLEILEQRLRSRGTETEESVQQRLQRAIEELKFGEIEGMFDLIITNDDIEKAYSILRQFILNEVEALKKSRGM
ncbi:hypothetical protein DERP_007780 [Dermatophagoides pteronyssinus]|uniref:guanylate kinase n=1 Tax=Dermatophagoides pteronyssinus TaxID=6956 RepID=A0ABQ8ISN7_DERPT|nr:hypothetical protein DERP_007780 [Dermatophagoides pteronyssinus]